MEQFRAGNPDYTALLDPRIKAIVPFAPWGGHYGTWDQAGLEGLKIPSLVIVGSQDRTANYSGVEFIFNNAVISDRYMLLYQNGKSPSTRRRPLLKTTLMTTCITRNPPGITGGATISTSIS